MSDTMINNIKTPSYIIDVNEFDNRVNMVRSKLDDNIGLVFSIKANPFLTKYISNILEYIEVCSPGELTICEKSDVDLGKIIFSGVNKTEDDVKRAMKDNVGIFTAESLKHVKLINDEAVKNNKKVPVILRLSSGNQFGMDRADIENIYEHRDDYEGLDIIGLHMYTGTQKKKSKVIKKELDELGAFADGIEEKYGVKISHIEYGPGIAVEYFDENGDATDEELLGEVCEIINEFAKSHPVTIEMGRFLASTCGTYFTKVCDTKVTGDINYCICDGGIHQVTYYGQTMAMKIPNMEVIDKVDDETRDWSVCGSLCTVADVLVRKVSLTGLGKGSIIAFKKVGAYSVCEGIALFLSRELPAVYIKNRDGSLIMARDIIHIDNYNMEVLS